MPKREARMEPRLGSMVRNARASQVLDIKGIWLLPCCGRAALEARIDPRLEGAQNRLECLGKELARCSPS